MRKIVVAAFVSLDGVMQAPGGPDEDASGGFEYGGWTTPYGDEVLGAAIGEGMAKPFDLLLGRNTYDIFAAHWPYIATDPSSDTYDEGEAQIARTFNGTTKYVATHEPDTLAWENSQWLGEDAVAALRDLKKKDGPDLLIWGSSDLIQQLLAADLIDELNLMIYPLALGKGKRLFGDGTTPAAFKVVKSRVSTTGVVIATYERDGKIRTGSFARAEPSEAELERRRKLASK
jgi:dihydrofolate reductase